MTTPRFTREEIFAGVREDVADCLAVEIDEVTLDANFEYDLGGDSIDYMDLFFRAQKRFGIRSPLPRFNQISDGPMDELPVRLAATLPRIQWTDRLTAMSTNDLKQLFTIDLIVELLFDAQFEQPTLVVAGSSNGSLTH